MKKHVEKQQTMFYTAAVTDEDVLLALGKSEDWVSRRQIAERLWRKVTPSLVTRLERLVGEGKLEKHSIDLPNHQVMFWYRGQQGK